MYTSDDDLDDLPVPEDGEDHAVGQVVRVALGRRELRIRLAHRVPDRLRGAAKPDWYGTVLDAALHEVGGVTFQTAAGLVMVLGAEGTAPAEATEERPALPAPFGLRDAGIAGVMPENELQDLVDAAREFARHARAPNTMEAYRRDWKAFQAFCGRLGRPPLPAPAELVALFLAGEAERGLGVDGVYRRAAAIRYVHRQRGVAIAAAPGDPISAVLSGIARTRQRPPRKAKPLLPADLRAICEALPASLRGLRDRAILLVGFAGALRRSEIAGLDVEGIEIADGGMLLDLAHAKGDRDGRGQRVAVPRGRELCPVAAVEAWLAAADVTEGPVFRPFNRLVAGPLPRRLSEGTINQVVKDAAAAAGLEMEGVSAHSLRRGWNTAVAVEKDVAGQQRHSRHKSVATTLAYIDAGDPFDHPGRGLL